MTQALKALLRSRKALSALAGILVTLVLLGTGQLDAETATGLITAQISVLIVSIAVEDAAEKSGKSRHTEVEVRDAR